MIIKSETIEGKTYILSDSFDIWCVEAGYDGTLTMQRLGEVSRDQVDAIMQPTFARWVRRP